MTLLAAFAELLHRYSGQEDLVVGTPIAGRGRARDRRADRLLPQHPRPARRPLRRSRVRRAAGPRPRPSPWAPTPTRTSPSRSWSRSCSRTATSPAARSSRSCSCCRTPRRRRWSCPGWRSRRCPVEGEHRQVRPGAHPRRDGRRRSTGRLEYDADLFDRPTIERLLAHLTARCSARPPPPGAPPLRPADASRRRSAANSSAAGTTPQWTFRTALRPPAVRAQAERTPEAVALTCGRSG